MDATNSQGSRAERTQGYVGKVNGEKITYNEFTKKYEENVKGMEDQMRGQPVGDDQRNLHPHPNMDGDGERRYL